MGGMPWLCWRILEDLIALVPVAAVALGVLFIQPFHRGFFLNDTSLSYPYRSSTVSTLVLSLVAPSIAVVMIVIVEVLRGKTYGLSRKFRGAFLVNLELILPTDSRRSVSVCTRVLVNVGKVVIGRLRPHFFAVCQPKNFIAAPDVYITQYKCGGTDKERLEDVRLSFPSGHSGFAMYTAVFIAIYLYYRVPRMAIGIALRNLFQIAALSLGTYVSITRISDYKHHPTDVLAGIVLGTLVAVYTLVFATQKDEFEEETVGEESSVDEVKSA
ncbi:hypothetical protein AAHC03_017214 [Spirometra sp. Aus1]